MKKRDFLKLGDLTGAEHRALFQRAAVLKAMRARREAVHTLDGRSLLLLFEKSSTRTRLSFEAAIGQLGGHAISLSTQDSQLARGEPLEDTARVASRYVDAIVFRTHGDERLEAFARASSVPVINGLSDGGHPVQLLADLFTIEEKLGRLAGVRVAYVGDASSNMGRSFCEAVPLFGIQLAIAAPEGYRPPPGDIVPGVELTASPADAVAGADVVVTDVWISMGQEAEADARHAAFRGFLVDAKLMARAKPDALVLHCLPAHRGEEIASDVIDGPQSVVWDEAENRMHVQKALLETLLLSQ